MIHCDDVQSLDPNTWVDVWSIECDGRLEFYGVYQLKDVDIDDYAVQIIEGE